MELNKKYLLENANAIDALFNDELSLKGNDLRTFLKSLPNVTNYGLPVTGGIANMDGIPLHLSVSKHFSDKPESRYQVLIVNTSSLVEPGEHWFILGSDWGGKNPIVGDHFLFDSYGRTLGEIYEEADEKIPKNIALDKWNPINSSTYQSLGTNVCGYYCLDVLSLLNDENISIKHVGKMLDQKYLNKRHPIFRRSHLFNTETALRNDLLALKNAETLGSIYTPTDDWYKRLCNELYE